ncbi:MAG: M56 family metallopeptidase [Bacteroidetes bacterium]|nr:M56 family metallopeptidase [Bacteroidota bacterium]
MMETIVFSSIKSSLCLVLLFPVYYMLLRKETFYRIKRFILLGIISVSVVLPFMKIPVKEVTVVNYRIQQLEERIVQNPFQFPENQPRIVSIPDVHISWTISPVSTVFLFGFIFQIVVLVLSSIRIIRLIRTGRRVIHGSHSIILVRDGISPFSFGRCIIISEKDYELHGREILIHEKMHLAQMHGIDLVLAELFLMMNWYNPVAWLLMREIRMNHEFEADRSVIREGLDETDYQLLLVRSATNNHHLSLANHFNQSKIKTRITMMNKTKSSRWAGMKTLLFIPLIILMLQVFARPELLKPVTPAIDNDNSKYLVLDKEQLKIIGLECTEKGVFYFNNNPRWKEDHKKYPVLCLYLTNDDYCNSLLIEKPSLRAEVRTKTNGTLWNMTASNHDYYPVLVTSYAGHPTYDAYRAHYDSTYKLLPVQIRMADLKLKSRKDTMVIWFKPTESLRMDLAPVVNIDSYLQAPDPKALGPMPVPPKLPPAHNQKKKGKK